VILVLVFNFVFPGMPTIGWVSKISLAVICGVIIAGIAIDTVYHIWTPPDRRTDHETIRIAIIGDGLFVLILLGISAIWPSARLELAILMALVIVLPIVLNIYRGSVNKAEEDALADIATYSKPSPRAAKKLAPNEMVRAETRAHPIEIVLAIPATILIIWITLWLGRHGSWQFSALFFFAGLGAIWYWYFSWYRDILVITEVRALRIFGVFRTKTQEMQYSHTASSSYDIPFISHWLAGNRYIKTVFGDFVWDTAAQIEALNGRKRQPNAEAVNAYIKSKALPPPKQIDDPATV
jgi:hypothetical protein